MVTIPELLAFYDTRKEPEGVTVNLEELRELVGEVQALRHEKAERAARHIRGIAALMRDLNPNREVA